MTNDERMTSTQERLEYLRGELRAGRISYGEIAELQSLADVELLEWWASVAEPGRPGNDEPDERHDYTA